MLRTEDETVTVIELAAAALLILGSVLVIRAVIVADAALGVEPSGTSRASDAAPLRRAA